MMGIVKDADHHNGDEDEQDQGYARHDHDVAGPARLLLSDGPGKGRQIDFGSRAFQPFRSLPRSFRPRIGDGVARIGFDPGECFSLVLRSRIIVKPCQQARSFRLDLFPAV